MSSQDNKKSSADGASGATPEKIPRGLLGKGGTPVTKSTRLPTVRAARDLTLGGAQRKSFKPNIPARAREKPTNSGPVEDKLVTKEKRIKKEKTDRPTTSKGHGRGQAVIIQSQSIFESGPTEKTIKRESIYGSGGGGGGGGGSSSVSIGNMKKTKKETQAILDQLLADDFIDDGEIEDITSQPVALPLLNPKKYEEAVKVELKLTEDKNINPTDPCLTSHIVDCPPDSMQLVLVQLPDCLPGLLADADDARGVRIKNEPSVASTSTTDQPPAATAEDDLADKMAARCKLTDLSEGRIGKLQIMKSGKTRLILGDVTFDMSRGAPCGFLQECVCVNAAEGVMACLGAVREKLVAVPNIESLLAT